ncbi:Leucine-rich repeat family protein [Gossypium australe]|uniref:Leucine-rich repeat family protein n=1 Tax=Gossypium australe TaxID=47621 RepID=A0A5B6UYG3_9ROSI|nr:Leucine-rich repeat family protein [Gossypium australe]
MRSSPDLCYSDLEMIANLILKLDTKKLANFKKNIEGVTKTSKFSSVNDGCLVFAYYKDGAVDPTFVYFSYALNEVKC